MKRLFFVLLVFAVGAHIGHGGMGSAWAEDNESLQTEIDAYLYAYPLVLMDVTRLYIEKTAGATDNVFFRGHVLAEGSSKASALSPDDGSSVSGAWLDLSDGPVIVHMPDFGDRCYAARLTDAWTNVFHTLGTATTGNEAHDFAVVGPRWKGDLPPGMSAINSPTDTAMILVRVTTSRAVEDIVAAYALQDRMSITLLSSYGKAGVGPIVQAPPVLTPVRQPAEQVAQMDAKAFFTRFVGLLMSNPPAEADGAMMARLASIGIVSPDFDFDELDPVVKDRLSRSIGPAQMKIRSSCLPHAAIDPTIDLNLGAYYLSRACSALTQLTANIPADTVCPVAETRAQSLRLSRKKTFPLRIGSTLSPRGAGATKQASISGKT